jgi:uroporphyrinogen-III decarboxylase
MRFSLEIDYPIDCISLSEQRMRARRDFRYADRVPVLPNLSRWYFLTIFGIGYGEFLKDAETQYYWWLQFAKYRMENIPEDFCQSTTVYVAPNFENVMNADALGAQIAWMDDKPPRVIPTIKSVDEIDRFEIPEPDAGLWGTALEWWIEMRDLARETEITVGGREGRVDVAPLAINGLGPFSTAVDLVGEDFYWWLLEYPEACHMLLDRITKGMIRAENNFRKVDQRPRTQYSLGEDSAQIVSPEIFREFCVPYDSQLYEAFGAGLADGRGMHMCGSSSHLHETLLRDLRITGLSSFSYEIDPTVVAENLGGKVYLLGNVNPMLMLSGSREEVKEAAKECLTALAPSGGFVLSDGGAVCPGTPIENLAALVEAAEEYGTPNVHPRNS